MKRTRSGKLVVISAPSGTGKSTVCHKLLTERDDAAVSISYTTRPPRGRERDGKHYHFIDADEFDRMIANDAFLEWAEVHGKRYGSGNADVQRLLDEGMDVLFDIDVQGGQQIKQREPDALLIFLLPPSVEVLVDRLRGRGTESDAQMSTRLRNAKWELKQGDGYDFHVVNEDLDKAVAQVNRIRAGLEPAERKLPELLQELLGDLVRHEDGTS